MNDQTLAGRVFKFPAARVGLEEHEDLSRALRAGNTFQVELLEHDLAPLSLVVRKPMVIGRRDTRTSFIPDVDLSAFDAYKAGVSRRHAELRVAEEQVVVLVDLASANGTYLNGQRIEPHRPRVLQDGDEIYLGKFKIRLAAG